MVLRGFADFYYILLNDIMKNEIWRTVIIDGVVNDRYEVSNFGDVRCLNWHNRNIVMVLPKTTTSKGYVTVHIDKKPKLVHRLVAEAFLPKIENKNYIDHIDGDKKNNVVLLDDNENIIYTNLRWCTQKENTNNPITLERRRKNQSRYWLGMLSEKCPNSIKVVQLSMEGKFIKIWNCMTDIERELGIRHEYISACCRGRLKQAGGFKWMYVSDYKPPVRYISDIKALF